MSKKDILRIRVRLWSSLLVENFFLTHLSLVNSNNDILLDIFLDIPRDIYILSRISAPIGPWKITSHFKGIMTEGGAHSN